MTSEPADAARTDADAPKVGRIEIDQVAKTFLDQDGSSVEALKPISLDIASGAFVALVGPSGCGKSTLLNILAGFEKPSSGTARVNGAEIAEPDIQRGMVFQDYALFPWLSVEDNVAFGLKSKGWATAERRREAARWLELVGLKDFAKTRPAKLSGGMKQRVAIARTFATDPTVILMDEPFGALDALTRRFLQQELIKLWRENRKSVVFVTHSVQEAAYLADRIIVMTARPGRVKLDLRVDLDYPRDMKNPRFHALEAEVYEALDEELRKTFALETSVDRGD